MTDEPDRKTLKRLHKLSNKQLIDLLAATDSGDLSDLDDWLERSNCKEIISLRHQRDVLKQDVVELANLNYAREPIFAKDRKIIRDKLADIERHMRKLALVDLSPAIKKLTQARNCLADKSKKLEQECDRLTSEYLNGSKSHQEFIDEYLATKKQGTMKRILTDKLTQEINRLAENNPSYE